MDIKKTLKPIFKVASTYGEASQKLRFKRRLLRLAAELDKLPPERFDFNTWVGLDWNGKQETLCGTTACGLGLAASMPYFRRLGLHLTKHHTSDDYSSREYTSKYIPALRAALPHEAMIDVVYEATAKVFGLSPEETRFLFTPGTKWSEEESNYHLDENATAGMLAEHIREFVSRR